MEVEIWLNACFLSPLHGLKKYYTTPKTSMHITHVHVGCSIIKKKKNQLFHVQYLFNGLTTGN